MFFVSGVMSNSKLENNKIIYEINLRMHCCVPFCTNTSNNVLWKSNGKGDSRGLSFHGFPSESHLRAAWLWALGIRDTLPLDSAVVCSRHFLNDDVHQTESGLRQISAGSIPTTVLVCMVCLQTDCELLLLSKHKLEESYVKLTGYPLHDQRNLKQTVCVQCVQRLTDFSRFREQSLRARSQMMDLVEKHELITIDHVQMLDGTVLQPDTCDAVKEEYCVEDELTELDKIVCTEGETVVVKNEECCESVSDQSDSTYITENWRAVPMMIDEPHPFIDSTDMQLAAVSTKVSNGNASTDSNNRTDVNNDRITNCLVEPCDVKHAEEAVTIKDEALTGTWNVDTDTEDPQCAIVPDAVSASGHKPDVSSVVQSETDRFSNDIHIQRYGALDNSLLVERKKKIDKSKRKVKLSVHLRSHLLTGESDYTTTEKRTLASHTRTHTGEKPHSCNLCHYKAPTKSKLVSHMRTHTGEKPYSCEFCDYKAAQRGNLVNHMKTHSGEKLYSCNLCQYKVAEKRNLVSHMKTHTGEKPYSCNLCHYKAANSSNLVVHMRTHTGEKPYSCKLCDYRSSRKCNIMSHMRIHTGEKPYSCNLCHFKAAEKRKLVIHKRTHTGEKPYSCNLCHYKAAEKSKLVIHMRSHTGEKPYSCEFCDYKATKQNGLTMHMKTHTGEKPYSCKWCDYRSAEKRSLVNHMKTHTGEKPYSRKICDYRGTQKGNLMCHMQIHTGEKPYSCDLCHYKTMEKINLKRHLKKHTAGKPYSCNFCHYKAAHKSMLVVHMRTHTGEKPYSCKLCDYRSTQKCNLMTHMQNHSGEKA